MRRASAAEMRASPPGAARAGLRGLRGLRRGEACGLRRGEACGLRRGEAWGEGRGEDGRGHAVSLARASLAATPRIPPPNDTPRGGGAAAGLSGYFR